MQEYNLTLFELKKHYKKFWIYLACSFLLHLVLFFFFIVKPMLPVYKIRNFESINVDIVSFSEPSKKEVRTNFSKKEIKSIQGIENISNIKPEFNFNNNDASVVDLGKKDENKDVTKNVKEEDNLLPAPSNAKKIEEIVKTIKKEKKDEKLSQYYADLEKELERQKKQVSHKDIDAIRIYQSKISAAIQSNWVFSEAFLKGQYNNLEVKILIKIMPDGNIKELWFQQKSGNQHLDESAQRAILKSNPLPPLPESYPFYNVVLGFTPHGLKK